MGSACSHLRVQELVTPPGEKLFQSLLSCQGLRAFGCAETLAMNWKRKRGWGQIRGKKRGGEGMGKKEKLKRKWKTKKETRGKKERGGKGRDGKEESGKRRGKNKRREITEEKKEENKEESLRAGQGSPGDGSRHRASRREQPVPSEANQVLRALVYKTRAALGGKTSVSSHSQRPGIHKALVNSRHRQAGQRGQKGRWREW